MIHICELTKRYGERLALDGVSFAVRRGEVLGLLGLNGAGKSTTMNILTGYIGATSGTATIAGHDIAREPLAAKRAIGYLPEQPALYGDLRVGEQLDFVCDLRGVAARRREHLAEIADRVGIAPVMGRLIRNLSRGYRQRVGLAQALIGAPPVLVLDEPTAGLDPSQASEVRALICSLGETRTVIVSSHILSDIQAVCGRVIVLHRGRLLADDAPERLGARARPGGRLIARIRGAPEAVREALRGVPGLEEVEALAPQEPGTWEYGLVGAPGQDIREGVFRAVARADLPLLESRSEGTSLEEVFLRLVQGDREE